MDPDGDSAHFSRLDVGACSGRIDTAVNPELAPVIVVDTELDPRGKASALLGSNDKVCSETPPVGVVDYSYFCTHVGRVLFHAVLRPDQQYGVFPSLPTTLPNVSKHAYVKVVGQISAGND